MAPSRADRQKPRGPEAGENDHQEVRNQPGRLLLWAVLAGIWAIGLAVRLLYLRQIWGAPFFDLRIGDAASYHDWAKQIVAGDWLGKEVFYQAPLYPYFLSFIYRVFDDSAVTVRVIQAFIGATSCAILGAAGIRLFGRSGAIAGIGLALYPTAIFLDGLLEKSVLVTFFTVILIALLAIPSGRTDSIRSFATGVILGLLGLTRENALILALPILAWIFVGTIGLHLSARLQRAVLFLAGSLLVLLPVGIRNFAVGGQFDLTTAQFGPNLYIGNHPGAKGGYEALVRGHGSAADERSDATRLAENASNRRLTPGEVSSFWTNRALAYIRSEPRDWLKLIGRKLALIFNAAELSDTESQGVYSEWSWLLVALKPFDFGLLFALAVFGVFLTAASWRRLWFLYALGTTYALSVALFYVFARYRFPLVPVFMIFSAAGLIEAARSFSSRAIHKMTFAALIGIGALLFAHLPLDDSRVSDATHYASIATALSNMPDRTNDALEFYRRALVADSSFPGAQFGLGTLRAKMGRPAEAVPYYRAALASWPDYEEAHYNLGLALASTGRPQEAVPEYERALLLRPDDADAHVALARALLTLDHLDLALEQYRQGLEAHPSDVTALVGIGVVLAKTGRMEEAIAKFRTALEIDPQNAAAHNSLGTALASAGCIREALPHFERAVVLNPSDENARKNLEMGRKILANAARKKK